MEKYLTTTDYDTEVDNYDYSYVIFLNKIKTISTRI